MGNEMLASLDSHNQIIKLVPCHLNNLKLQKLDNKLGLYSHVNVFFKIDFFLISHSF